MDLTVGRRTFRAHDRMAIGSICSIYRCTGFGLKAGEGVLKIARDPRANEFLENESAILRQLWAADAGGRFTPFLPKVEESFCIGGSGEPARRANALRMHDEIRSPDELYTLAEVRAQYPAGLDGRDVAWIWRRLLTLLGFVHSQGVVHAAVLPMHVLIEPREHKLLLIDWCCATHDPVHGAAQPLAILAGGYVPWYRREGGIKRPPTPAQDVALGARCMIELLGGDAIAATFPAGVDPALQRYFGRCVGESPAARDAGRLLDDFDRLIEVLWGPRTFRALEMPPKARPRA